MRSSNLSKTEGRELAGIMETNWYQADYRSILRNELAKRCEKNPRYTQSAFARALSLSPSRLCEILQGKQGLSRESAQRMVSKLGLSDDRGRYFVNLVVSQDARGQAEREIAQAAIREFRKTRTSAKGPEILISKKVSIGSGQVNQLRRDLEEHLEAIVEKSTHEGMGGDARTDLYIEFRAHAGGAE